MTIITKTGIPWFVSFVSILTTTNIADAFQFRRPLSVNKNYCITYHGHDLNNANKKYHLNHCDPMIQKPLLLPHKSTKTIHYSTTTSLSIDNKVEEVDVVIIGAGFGGLSCAALCAKYGLKTLCVEAHDIAGGCAHSFQRYNNKAVATTTTKTTTTKSNTNTNTNTNKKEQEQEQEQQQQKQQQRALFRFDSGPSLISGLSQKSTNPLRQVLDAVGTADDVKWCTYDGWLVHDYADGKTFKVTTGANGTWEQAVEEKAGVDARIELERFQSDILNDLTIKSASIPPFALRGDAMAIVSMFSYVWKFLQIGWKGVLLTGPFTKTMEQYSVQNDFSRKWFDYLSFALSGLDAAHTQAAPVVYMMGDLHRRGAVLDYPMGGMDSLVRALVNGLTNHGGELRLNTRVERMILEERDNDGKAYCTGVVLDDGTTVYANKGVVSNAPLWNMARILEDSLPGVESQEKNNNVVDNTKLGGAVAKAVAKVRKQADAMEMTGSFMHLHLGIPKDGIDDETLECHHSMLNMDVDITAEQNLVIISIPTVFDPTLAPDGYHIVHAYTAASENFDDWTSFMDKTDNDNGSTDHHTNARKKAKVDNGKVGASPNSRLASKYNTKDGYDTLKKEKAEALWKAVECIIPDVRERAQQEGSVVLVGTPLTHRRYNQRYCGTYGPAPGLGQDVWDLPGPKTPIEGLLACGDTTFPGIGLPGVAASGTIAANTLVEVGTQLKVMKELKAKGALQ